MKPQLTQMKLRNFAKERYLRVAKAFPIIQEEHTQRYVMLILSFLAMSLLGLFAISPTINTIVELNRKLEDSKFVFDALNTKKAHLSSLHSQYDTLQTVWPVVDAAVPDAPNVGSLVGQVQEIAHQYALEITNIQTFPVELTKQSTQLATDTSFAFTISVDGPPDDLQAFVLALAKFDRVVRIESITLSNDEKSSLTVRLRAYFTP